MEGFYIGYKSKISLQDTIKCIDFIESKLMERLIKKYNLTKIDFAWITKYGSSYNSSDVKYRAVNFDLGNNPSMMGEIFQSRRKMIRRYLHKLNVPVGEGLISRANNFYRDSEISNTHSITWNSIIVEMPISEKEYNWKFLNEKVNEIHSLLLEIENELNKKFDFKNKLNQKIIAISDHDLQSEIKMLKHKERIYEKSTETKSFYLKNTGHILPDGSFDKYRDAEVDDWNLNARLYVYHSAINKTFHLMNISCKAIGDVLIDQLRINQQNDLIKTKYVKNILNGKTPRSWGVEINLARLFLFWLDKVHIAEVQQSIWPEDLMEFAKINKIDLI